MNENDNETVWHDVLEAKEKKKNEKEKKSNTLELAEKDSKE